MFVSVGLPAFLRNYLPPIQWLKLPLWPYFKGLYQIAAVSHPRSRRLPPAPRKSLIYVCCLCSSCLRGITSGFLMQQIKDGRFQPAPSHLFFLLCNFLWKDCAAFRNQFDCLQPKLSFLPLFSNNLSVSSSRCSEFSGISEVGCFLIELCLEKLSVWVCMCAYAYMWGCCS